ncbi:hypothetical protein [Chromobacterium haemolyticum]|uniref:hypothetical protein n=1 Tax=Chromobacterium haemolyticum TaxID=394935 RepID=UPI001745DFAF|nr:hypothetical protein [Chromobacterium haemolyticum]QOD81868.1 hypothetical protein IEZ30_18530 [Chromobacterium haemolyticum]
MNRIAISALALALAACSTGEEIKPVDTAKLAAATNPEGIKAALTDPAIGMTDVSITPLLPDEKRQWIVGTWTLAPASKKDWETISDNAYQLARAIFNAHPPGKLVINLTKPDGRPLTQYVFEPKKAEELGLKWNAINKAITKVPVDEADRTPLCSYLEGYDAAGAPSPAYRYCKH